jgi:DNA sulfur modification protein DndB
MGDWIFYVALVTFADVAERVRRADEIHKSEGLRDLLQRAISNRSGAIAQYLCKQEQRFFNALIVGIYEGDPTWHAVEFRDNVDLIVGEPLDEEVARSLGVLILSGKERIFAIDGQHRLEGIKKALNEEPGLAADEQTVIFVAHRNTADGMARTRRLFATLNRYAKPVSLSDIIALDEDDAVAICTRSLLEDDPLLSRPGVVRAKKTRSVPNKEPLCFTSIQALYEFLDLVLLPELSGKARKDFKALRPSDEKLGQIGLAAGSVISVMCRNVPALQAFMASASAAPASPFRSPKGGNLLFRPAGLLSFGRALQRLMQAGETVEHAVELLARLDFDLGTAPWRGVLWEAGRGRMIDRKGSQELASKLMLHMAGCDLARLRLDPSALLNEYRSILGQEGAALPSPLE